MRKIKVLAHLHDAPPHSRIGAFLATHRFLVGAQEAGHEVLCLIENRRPEYVLDGVTYKHEGPWLAEQIRRHDIVVSNAGGSGHGHIAAKNIGKPSVMFSHGSAPGFEKFLVRGGNPDLVVFNSNGLRKIADYDGPSIVCNPPVNPADFAVTPGDHLTLVNLTEEKGAHTFDQLARFLPERKFLAVRGGYGDQVELGRHNITIIEPTQRMRDAVYSRTRILLMPSLLETWGMVGVEAMCAGIPVIAHPAMGPKESLADAGLFANRDALDEWIDIIEMLDDAKAYAEQSAKCKERAAQLYVDATDGIARFVQALEETA